MYAVIRKIVDEHQQYESNLPKLTFATVYDEIKRSNSSLNRKNKRLLEDSIERVLDVIQRETGQEEDDDEEAALEGQYDVEDDKQIPDAATLNRLNRSIVGMWNTSSPKPTANASKGMAPSSESAETSQQAGSNKRRQVNGEPPSKKRKGGPSIDRSPPTHISLADLGGVDNVIQQLEDLIILPMTRPQIYEASKVQPPRGILLHGPPGCGKTMICNAFAAELGVSFINISAPSIVSGMSGESERALRDHFDEAKKAAPCLIFIDEIDAITPKRESAQREMEKRIVAQLLTCMDDLALEKTDGKPVIVLAATNRPDSLDPALRRGGRFDKEINMSVPSEPVREQILRALTRQMSLSDDVDLPLLANRTPGFVGADLNDLVSTTGAAAIKRYLDHLREASESTEMDIEPTTPNTISPTVLSLRRLIAHAKSYSANTATDSSDDSPSLVLTQSDFLTALPKIQPSALREGFATVPSTTFSDVGALSHIRSELQLTVVSPILHPELYTSVGITAPTGLLLWGPPGCGKTLLAKAVANESRANFISVKGPELLNKFVGESERAVRQVFVRARSSIPCVIFFDELDALVPRRTSDALSDASARVVNTLLTELDGLGSSRSGIYVLAATNRPDIIDPAMLRPGRLETLLYVDLPGPEERVEILRTLTRKLPDGIFNDDVAAIARKCDGFSGADLESLVRRAGYSAIRRGGVAGIELDDWKRAREVVGPSVRDVRKYERLRREWGDGAAAVAVTATGDAGGDAEGGGEAMVK